MRKRNLLFFPILSCLISGVAVADWQYPGTYVGDGWYEDDGSRFIISARGGAAFGMGKIKNQVGAIVNEYLISPDGSTVVTEMYCEQNNCDGYIYAGYGDLSQVVSSKNFKGFSFAAGASIGWTIPYKPQWRIEAGWDHISETEYNASPMFDGDLDLIGGDISGVIINVQSASVQSKISTDVLSAMVFYDFYDGLYKPLNQIIPYIGVGIGYADSKTTLNLSDPYGDLSVQPDLWPYGEFIDNSNVIRFYKSEYDTSNVVGIASFGIAYGINDAIFLDFGVRAMYIPQVKWELSNEDGTKHREFFSADDMFYINAMVGLRFEF